MAKPDVKVRKNYRISPDLVKWAQKYAKKKDWSETEVIEKALERMKEQTDAEAARTW